MTAVFQLRGVSKSFGRRVALADVSLSAEPGIIGLLGPNGSGKSTLIKTLLGLVRPQKGSIEVLGQVLPGAIRAIRDLVGFVPEDDCYFGGMSGVESAWAMARLSGLVGKEGLRRAHEVLDFSDVGQERYRAVESYSSGMRQKLKFAQSLVHDPALLILDEPTAGLDPDQRQAMLSRIALLSKKYGKSILLSTHILHDVREVCDSVIILSRGRVRRVDTLANMSRPIRPGVNIKTLGSAELLASRLRELGHEVTQLGSEELDVFGVDPSAPSELWQIAGKCHAIIRRLQPASNSLEQIFLEAVQDSHNAAA